METRAQILQQPATVPLTDSFAFVRNAPLFIVNNFARYSDYFRLTLPGNRLYAVANPDVIQHILVKNERNYAKSRMFWGQLRKLVGISLGTAEGEEWVGLRKLQMKAFNHDAIQTHLQQLIDSAEQHFEGWENRRPFDVVDAFSILNVSVLLKVLFGYHDNDPCAAAARAIEDGIGLAAYRSKFPWSPLVAHLKGYHHRFNRHVAFFENLTTDVIERRLRNPQVTLLIDLLIAESTFVKEGASIDRKQIRNEIIMHLGGGAETVAVGMGWTLYMLWRHPDQLKKLRDEISHVLGTASARPEHYPALRFTDLVVRESLRLFPPSNAIVRDAVGEDECYGFHIRKGDSFFLSLYGLHRNPRLWDRPNEFVPERFTTEPERYSYIPFGSGRHSCIGRYLAQPMLVLTLATFIQKFDFSFHISGPVNPLPVSTLRANQPLIIQLKRNTV